MEEVPSYRGAFGGPMGATIEQAVQMALAGFLRAGLRGRGRPRDAAGPRHRGRLPARAGRGQERPQRRRPAVGVPRRRAGRLARAVRHRRGQRAAGGERGQLRRAHLRLHRPALGRLRRPATPPRPSRPSRMHERHLDRLGQALLRGDPADAVLAAAEQAEWAPPSLAHRRPAPRGAGPRRVLGSLPPETLTPSEAPGLPDEGLVVLLVPEMTGPARRHLLRALAQRQRGRRAGPAVAGRAGVVPSAPVRALAAARRATRRSTPRTTWPRWSWTPTPTRARTCGPGCSRRSPGCGRRPSRS